MSSVELRRAKERYNQCAYEARNTAVIRLRDYLGVSITLSDWSNKAFDALSHWPSSIFDWQEIRRIHREVGRLEIAIWSGENRLSGLALALCTGQAVVLRFVEGDPRQDCPIIGKRLIIALETATNYAQAVGKNEIRVQPKNEKLVRLYEEDYGFEYHKPYKEECYFRKGV